MKLTLPTGKRGQLLVIIANVGIAALIGIIVVKPYYVWRQQQLELIETHLNILSQMREVSADIPQLRQNADKAGRQLEALVGTAKGTTASLAAAQLQQTLGELAGRSGVRVERFEALAPQETGPWEAVRIRVAGTASWSGVIKLLESIATNKTTMIIVNELQLSPYQTAPINISPNLNFVFTATSLRIRKDGGDANKSQSVSDAIFN